ncbi:MAG: VWA domain-containing protein, partial [Acidobacteriota bacterium]
DFSILEDGRPRELYRLDTAEVPLQVALLLDTSDSMREALAVTQEAAVYFVESLNPKDRVTLIPFSSDIRFIPQLTDDPGPIKQAIRSTRARGATKLYDALLFAMKYLAEKEGRKAIVAFSDGQDTARSASLSVALNAAARYGYPIYTIGAGSGLRSEQLKRVLRQLAEINSGKCYYVEEPRDLKSAFSAVAGELRAAFVLNYYTQVPHDGRWHDVAISLPDPRYKIHSRKGFYARASSSRPGFADPADRAPMVIDAAPDWTAGELEDVKKSAAAATAEILLPPLPARPMGSGTISPDPPAERDAGQATPVFKVETRFIEVPVLVESVGGREMPLLAAKDFRIYEDGSLREIAYFKADVGGEDMMQIRDAAREKIKAAGPPSALMPEPGDPRQTILGRQFLILDDLLTAAQDFLSVKKAAEQIVRENHSPLRPVSLHFASHSEADLTPFQNMEALVEAIRRAAPRPNSELTSNDDVMSVHEAYLVEQGNRQATLLAELRVASNMALQYQNDLGSVDGQEVADPQMIQSEVLNTSRMLIAANFSQANRLLDGLRAAVNAAAADPGDYPKAVILISSGFVMGRGDTRFALQRVADLAKRRGLRLSTIDATGLAVRQGLSIRAFGGFLVRNPQLVSILHDQESGWVHERESTLNWLARETGGLFVRGTNDLAAAAARAVRSTGQLYYLGYLSRQPSDGRFHQIRVSTAAPGARVHARKGYFTGPRSEAETAADEEGGNEDWEALLASAEAARIAGDTGTLISSLERLVRKFPQALSLWYNLGVARMKGRDHVRAIEAFQQAFLLAPEDKNIGMALARAFVAAGSGDAAADTVIMMIQQNPGDPGLMLQLGRIFETSHKIFEAYQVYRRMLDFGSGMPLDLYLALTRTSASLGRDVEAGIFIRDYLARGGSEEAIQPWLRR